MPPLSQAFTVASYVLRQRLRGVKRYPLVLMLEPLLRCKHSRREQNETDRWTLFRVHLHDDVARQKANVRISPMQAMYRADGPRLD